MPSRNREKLYASDTFYHVYNRGVEKRIIFKDADDYAVFLNLLKRYLDDTPTKDLRGREYDWLHNDIELLSFCPMPNHFHLFIYQKTPVSMTRLLRGVATSYTTYFNRKYKRVGPLFQDRFKASMILSDEYLQHISRYIHLNPTKYKSWPYSSLPYYLGKKHAGWINTDRILEIFNSAIEYQEFVEDFESHNAILKELKKELANY